MRQQQKPIGPEPFPGTPEPSAPPGTGPIIPDPGPRPKPEHEGSPLPDIERGSDGRPRETGSPSRMSARGAVRTRVEWA